MNYLDWIVLFTTLITIVVIGVLKSRGNRNIDGYLLGDKNMRWWTIGLSIMATQASAITFLSTPGQAYEDGMRFIQIYFGLPLAMVILCITFIPIYHRLRVFTAYEYLETRFDYKTRTLGALLFLIQRGLGAGITIYAPSIILSTILDLNLTVTTLIIGVLVIIYTVSGGTRAVSITQKQQMAVMMGGMILAGILLLNYLPEDIGFTDALNVAGYRGKLNIVDLSFDLNDRYNIWSGIIGGLFIGLSYFGTDQSQVQRYLSGRSIRESRLGLIFNGLLKIPMQFIILFIGALVFVFFQFNTPPIIFNEAAMQDVRQSSYNDQIEVLEKDFNESYEEKKSAVRELVEASRSGDHDGISRLQQHLETLDKKEHLYREEARELISKANGDAETNDTDYVFIGFIVNYLPHGLIGILLAVIFSAAMSSTASELNALSSTTTVDIYRRSVNKQATDRHYLTSSRWFTLLWGVIAISFASVASLLENLIELVNIVGSIFYGSILGIFLAAFYIPYIRSTAVFWAAIVSQVLVIVLFLSSDIGYLWYNVIGCGQTVLFALILQTALQMRKT